MHGRVKVLRTVEQEELRRIKKKAFEEEFRSESDSLLNSRRNGELNEDVLNRLTTVIEKCPDSFSFWNYRRDIIKHLFKVYSSDKDKISSLLKSDLELTSRCLLASPKSYPTWHHRLWLMKNHISPDWHSELEFCNCCLKADERNFHCWDYRRFIVSKGVISNEPELEYSRLLIEHNLSNYSAWHYRGGLLGVSTDLSGISSPLSPPPQFHAQDDSKKSHFSFADHPDELDMVHNALYTDPVDQSPWFYFRHLLSQEVKKVYLRELYLSRSIGRLVLVFSAVRTKPTLDLLHVSIKVFPCGSFADPLVLTPCMLGGWRSALKGGVSAVWWLPLNSDIVSYYARENQKHSFQYDNVTITASVCVTSTEGSDESKVCEEADCPDGHVFCLHCTMDAQQNESLTRVALDPYRLLNPMISSTHEPKDLINELNTVGELVEIEPHNKWALLTFVGLLRYVKPTESKDQVMDILKILEKTDTQRATYYKDLTAYYNSQDILVNVYRENSREVILSNLNISHVDFLDWYALVTKLDLSNNLLFHLPDTFAYLLCLVDLNLDDNKLRTLDGISQLPSLENLSVQRNALNEFKDIEDLLHCATLRVVIINGNAVTKLNHLTSLISAHPGSQRRGCSFNLVYDKVL